MAIAVYTSFSRAFSRPSEVGHGHATSLLGGEVGHGHAAPLFGGGQWVMAMHTTFGEKADIQLKYATQCVATNISLYICVKI